MSENLKLRGLDVSNWQGAIDWPRVAAQGLSFAYVKATEGTTFCDPYFSENTKGATDAGLAVGAYHFFRAQSTGEAFAEAEFFLKQTEGFRLSLPPALDIEIPPTGDPAAFQGAVVAWLEYVSARTPRTAVVYSYPAFITQYLDDPRIAEYPLWIASWDRMPTGTIGAWEKWAFWQYTCSGSLNGISGRVCLDIHQGALDETASSLNKDPTKELAHNASLPQDEPKTAPNKSLPSSQGTPSSSPPSTKFLRTIFHRALLVLLNIWIFLIDHLFIPLASRHSTSTQTKASPSLKDQFSENQIEEDRFPMRD